MNKLCDNRHMNIYYIMADEETKKYMIATVYLIYYAVKTKWKNEGKSIEQYGKLWDSVSNAMQEQYGVSIEQAAKIARDYYGLPLYNER